MTAENENRVFSRTNARVISKDEMIVVNGGVLPHTNTACTFNIRVLAAGGNGADGDTNECTF